MTQPVSRRQEIERAGRLMCRARRALAYGNLDSILQKPLEYGEGLAFPQFIESVQGYELTDTTGQTFVDWVCGGGPVLLGHRRPEVEEAIREQMRAGPTLSLMHPLEVEVAETLIEMVPCADMVAFGKNGSDSLTAATRLARCLTGREVVVQHGMHGFHDWYVCHNPIVRGAPEALKPLIHPFQYNDLEGLSKLLERLEGRVAAVVMEPVREVLPQAGYLEGVRELTRRHGALLVFDEVVTAFRLGNGGAQALFGVEPDLACLGKAMANGMPISALVGRRELMEQLPAVAFGMTFRGETLTLAAARAALGVLRSEPVAEHVARIGTQVRDGFEEACARRDLHIGLGGPPGRMTFVFQEDGGIPWDSLQALFVQECLKRGIFTNGNVLPSFAHDEVAVRRTLEGFDGALAVVAEAVHGGRRRGEEGAPEASSLPRAMISIGYLEELRRQGEELALSGWTLLDGGPAEAVEIATPSGEVHAARALERPDIAAAHPAVAGAERAGYAAVLPLAAISGGDRLQLDLRFLRGGRLAFLCRVIVESPPDDSGAWPGPHWTGDGFQVV